MAQDVADVDNNEVVREGLVCLMQKVAWQEGMQ